MRHALWVLLAVAGTLGAAGSPADDGIHACRDAAGNVVYQDDPCVEPRPAPPVPVKPAAKRTAAPQKVSRAVVPAPRATPAPQARWVPSAPLRSPAPTDGSIVRTWEAFVAAVNSGDRAAALACLTPAAAKDLSSGREQFPTRSVRDAVSGQARVVDEGEVGPYWSLRLVRADLRPKWVFFERIESGAWKIAAL
jgi:hypothetical protein